MAECWNTRTALASATVPPARWKARKPTAVVVPLIAAALDWGVFRRSLRDIAKPIAGLLLLIIPFAVIAMRVQTAALTETPPLWSRPIIAADALAFYAGKIALPFRVRLDYGRAPVWLLDQPGFGWTWLAIIPLGLALWMLRRHRWLVAGVAVLVASLLPVLGLTKFDFQHHSTVADRYVYLGMLGPAVLLALAAVRGGRKTAIICTVVLLLLAARSRAQAWVWKDGTSIFRATLATNPSSLLTHRGLGSIALSLRLWSDAEAHFADALRTRPNDPVTNFHLGTLYLSTGRPKQAVPPLRIAADALDQPWVVTNFANALAQSGNLPEAQRVLEEALVKTPAQDRAELHATLAAIRFRQGDPLAAANEYRAALRINPRLTFAVHELAALERATSVPSTAPTE